MGIRSRLEIVANDLQYSIRSLARSRAFSALSILALALGIGAGTAVFSVVDRIVFRSLPYKDAGRLLSFGMSAPISPQEFLLSYDYLDWRERQTPFEAVGSWVAGVQDCDLNDARPMRLQCGRIDSTLLPALGVSLAAGRNFTVAEENPGAPRAALISYSLWRRRFGQDPAAVGRTIPVDGQPATIVGILPAAFELPSMETPDILLPHLLDDPEQRSRRLAILVFCVGRLKPGISQPQAAAALQPLFQQSLESVPASFRKDVGLRVRDLRDRQIQDSRLASWVLLGSVLAVLLIACANAANLQLARAAARGRELAIRAALGGGRGRLAANALGEAAILSVAAGLIGTAFAAALLRFFIAIAPQGIPRLPQAGIDVRVLVFTLLLSLVSAVFFGLAPALRGPQMEALGGGRPFGPRRQIFRQSLVAGQICVSLILLAGAGLLLRSLWNIENQQLGLRTENVLTAGVWLGRASYPDPARRLAFFETMEQRLRRIPGVTGVAITDSLPPGNSAVGNMLYGAIDVRGRPRFADGTGGQVVARLVTPEYFSVLGVPILQGRAFIEEDRLPGHNVIILSEALARRMFPGENALGRELKPGRNGEWRTVVGVAANVKNSGIAAEQNPEYYEIRKHDPANVRAGATAIIRAGIPVEGIAGAVRAEIAALDPTLPVSIQSMERHVSKFAERPRFNALLLGMFAGFGLLLAAIGLYGVVSFVVAERAQEIGVRMAVGATPAAIARLVLGQAGRWTAAGAGAGAIGSLFAVRLLERMLFRVRAWDPWTFAAVLAVLAAVALAAAWIPSRRAARVDPMCVLRRD